MKQPILTLLFLAIVFTLSCETTKKQTKSTSPEESQKITTVENREKNLTGDDNRPKSELSQKKKGTLSAKNMKYEGEIENGKPHGYGKLFIYDDNGNLIKTIEGKFENGNPSGEVTITKYSPDGKVISKFQGKIKEGTLDKYSEGSLTNFGRKGKNLSN
ncbi:MAG: hypothetical protein KBG49_03565 [Spirochaetes bacterium]|nr:hypothetical protein [Spirochaetota bacterium]